MGLSQSKTIAPQPVIQQKALDLTPQFTAPNGVVEKLKGLGEVINYFNDNDTSSLESFIDKYNQQVSAKDQIDVGPEIKAMMMNFHNQLLTVIDTQLVGATTNEKKQALNAKLKDNKQLNEMLRLYYNQRMQDIETRVLEDEVVKSNPEITDTVRVIMNNVKSLKVKYKFFEYKYIQMNIFMIVFIQYVYNSMGKFIVDVIAYNQTRDAIRQEMTQKIFKATQDIMGASDMQLKPQDAESINKMIANLQEKIQRDQKEIQELSGQLKNNSLSDLLNFVLTSDETLGSHIMEGVDKFKAGKTTFAEKPISSTSQVRVQPPMPPMTPMTPMPPMQTQQQPQQSQQPQQPQQTKFNAAKVPYTKPTYNSVSQVSQVSQVNPTNPANPNPNYLGKKPFNPNYQGKNPQPGYVKPPQPSSNVKKSNANAQKASTQPQTITSAPTPPPQLGGFIRDNSLIASTSASASQMGGFIRDNSLVPQTGGFIRDNSLLPQPFFELNK
jgi:hypothetical protein